MLYLRGWQMVDPKKYLVLDLETNGLKPESDDLLSISIYKPDDGRTFDRFLPLEKQDQLNPEATWVNGIKPEDLDGKKPLSQEEVNTLIDEFEMRERTILTFGGSHGASGRGFDERFLKQYFDDHGLAGMSELNFYDFKRMVHSGNSMLFPATKDNLCRAFGIEGVAITHSSLNDCILEWKLFEAMDECHLLVTEGNVFKMNHDYVVPASYLDRFSGLRKYAGVPKRYAEAQNVFELELSEETTKEFLRFPTNISGVTVEHLINTEVRARKIDSREKLLENKSKLEYIGSFPGVSAPIPVEQRDDGLTYLSSSVLEHAAKSVRDEMGPCALADVLDLMRANGGSLFDLLLSNNEAMKEFWSIRLSPTATQLSSELEAIDRQSEVVEAAARADRAIKPELGPLTDFLKKVLGPEIMTQELVVDQSEGCLALCDLSSQRAVVEIKTGSQGYDSTKFVNQLYYQAHGRDCYALHIEWGKGTPEGISRTKFIVEKVKFTTTRPRAPRQSSGKLTRRYAIRHAITEWRYSHPRGGPKGCAKALWLKSAEVEKAWPKADPNVMYERVPYRGKQRLAFERMVAWRKAHPRGTRLELADDTGISVSDVEKWWYQASMPVNGGEGSAIPAKMDNETIREMISEYTDKSCQYLAWTDEEIEELKRQVWELCRQAGMPVTSDCSVPYWPKEHYLPKERKVIVPELKSVEDHCREELRSGTKVLRIPLHMTRYKTKVCYMWLDPLKARISRKESPDNGEEGIAIIATNREIAVLKPGDDLYETARDLVGKWIRRVFIERLYEDKEGQVVIVVDNIPDMIKPRV